LSGGELGHVAATAAVSAASIQRQPPRGRGVWIIAAGVVALAAAGVAWGVGRSGGARVSTTPASGLALLGVLSPGLVRDLHVVKSQAPPPRAPTGSGSNEVDVVASSITAGVSPSAAERAVDAKDKPPPARVSVESKQAFDDTTLTADAVVAKAMVAYMAGLKHCYRAELKRDPRLHGKLALAFTVSASGRLTNGKATGVDEALDTCAANQMSSWRFSVPKDKDGAATEASFALALALVPD